MTYDIDMTSLGGALDAFFKLASGALTLQEAAFATVDEMPAARQAGTAIVLLAGASQLLGQSVALFLNGVRPARFALSMLLAAGVFFAGVLVWVFAVWGAAVLLVDPDFSLSRAGAVIALGHAPYLLSFLLLIPYYGPGLERLLGIWTVACVAVGLTVAGDFNLAEAALAIAVGFLFVTGAKLLVGRWVTAATERLFQAAAGRRGGLRVETALEDISEQARLDTRRWFGR